MFYDFSGGHLENGLKIGHVHGIDLGNFLILKRDPKNYQIRLVSESLGGAYMTPLHAGLIEYYWYSHFCYAPDIGSS